MLAKEKERKKTEPNVRMRKIKKNKKTNEKHGTFVRLYDVHKIVYIHRSVSYLKNIKDYLKYKSNPCLFCT